MRIIDKNSDFYDYIQNIYYDNSLTFDRTNSFLLTKDFICSNIWDTNDDSEYLLLQICNTFWLFLLKITEKNIYNRPINYNMELLTTWKNYNKKRELIKLDIISFPFIYKIKKNTYNEKTLNTFIQRINTNDYKIKKNLNTHTIWQDFRDGFKKIKKDIPLLKACGIASIVNPVDIYLSIEEYFSLEKTASERTESIGITDIDKLENHGFDKRISFRNIKNN